MEVSLGVVQAQTLLHQVKFKVHSQVTMALHKVNAKYFQQVGAGSSVQIAGQLSQDGVLQATDGQTVALSAGPVSQDLRARPGFVELVGKKDPSGALIVEEIRSIAESLDCDVWNGAIEMRHHPELKQFFDPSF
jgi:hypothetical protein